MKYKQLVISLFSAAAFAAGCKPSDEQTTAEKLGKVEQKTKEAAREMKDYSYAQKAEFVEKMQAQLAEINQDLDELSAKIEKSSATAKAEAKPKLQALRGQADKLNKQLDDAKNATESTWEEVKASFKKGTTS